MIFCSTWTCNLTLIWKSIFFVAEKSCLFGINWLSVSGIRRPVNYGPGPSTRNQGRLGSGILPKTVLKLCVIQDINKNCSVSEGWVFGGWVHHAGSIIPFRVSSSQPCLVFRCGSHPFQNGRYAWLQKLGVDPNYWIQGGGPSSKWCTQPAKVDILSRSHPAFSQWSLTRLVACATALLCTGASWRWKVCMGWFCFSKKGNGGLWGYLFFFWRTFSFFVNWWSMMKHW